MFGIPGWFLSGRVLKRSILPRNQLQLYEKLMPIFQRIERMLGRRLGVSVVCIARKPERAPGTAQIATQGSNWCTLNALGN